MRVPDEPLANGSSPGGSAPAGSGVTSSPSSGTTGAASPRGGTAGGVITGGRKGGEGGMTGKKGKKEGVIHYLGKVEDMIAKLGFSFLQQQKPGGREGRNSADGPENIFPLPVSPEEPAEVFLDTTAAAETPAVRGRGKLTRGEAAEEGARIGNAASAPGKLPTRTRVKDSVLAEGAPGPSDIPRDRDTADADAEASVYAPINGHFGE